MFRILFLFSTLSALAALAEPLRFNRDVRPILSDRCYACHGPDKNNRKTKMRLDTEEAAKADLGKGKFAIVEGQPEKSEIYKRVISSSKSLRMPPEYLGHERLKDSEVAVLKRWIEEGAHYEPHWSFIPPQRPAQPTVSDAAWVRNPVDAFILSRLEREGLKPSPAADKRTLLRRVTLDLTGLPPTPEEVDAFVKDEAPGAYERVVDRLLASTRYAERMAIRWLEAARYSDTNGYSNDGPRYMWRWRDWVIDAFHKDMPFDRFTVEQIAGDLLPNATMEQKLATGFHRNHRTNAEGGIVDEEFRVEYVADRAETTATVWMGLTLGCARCHDHKFDPLSQKDFYSMFAFFNNVAERGFVWNFGNQEPVMLAPLPDQQKRLDELSRIVEQARAARQRLDSDAEKAQRKWEKKTAKQNEAIDWLPSEAQALHLPLESHAELPAEAGVSGSALRFDGKQFVDAGRDGPRFNYMDPFTFAAWIRPETDKGAILTKGEDDWEGTQHGLYVYEGKLRLHVTFRWSDLAMRMETVEPLKLKHWQHVAVTYDGSRRAAGVRMYVDGKPREMKVLFDSLLWPLETKEPWRVGAGGGLRFQGLIDDVRIYSRSLSAAEIAALPVRATVTSIARMKPAARSEAEQAKLKLCFLERYAPAAVQQAQARLRDSEKQLASFRDTVPTSMVMQETPGIRETFVLNRGAYDAPGEKVTAAVPAVLPQLPAGEPANRLALARWLVDRNNPLTARVAVNRYWAMLFGTGLVKTVEDFGSQGEWPKNQELLDWLAVEFMDSGWSIKHVLRTIVTSAAYRQSSRVTPELLQRDPENRLLARGPRFRLSAEMIRDQALAVSGLLVDKTGGPPVKPYQPPGLWQELTTSKGYEEDQGEGLYRRSLYTFWKRTIAPPSMINFDAATREACVVRESRTNTPLQALNLMNDVTYVEASRKLAERILRAEAASDESRLTAGWQTVTARQPRPEEQAPVLTALRKLQKFYEQHPDEAAKLLKQGNSPADASLPAPQLAAWTGVASILLNLDETVTKE